MIKFFRKIRYDLMEKNKTRKYLKYAIGEIILVMVGILLALQVSTWNQQRIATQKEELLLEALNEEFVKNKAQFEGVVVKHKQALASTQFAISQFPINPETIDLDTYYAGMRRWGKWSTFNPTQGVIRSLVNTSSFELISNPELRVLLVLWEDVLADYKEEEDQALYVLQNFLYPEIADHISWVNGMSDDRSEKGYLSTIQYENVFVRRENDLKNILGWEENEDNELKLIKMTIDRIIELSKPLK